MSEFSEELEAEVSNTMQSVWTTRAGQVIPETEDLKLGNDRVTMEAVLLYADLADSTELAIHNKEITSEICKAYLSGVTKIIRRNGGAIRSFDGDRVMGIFLDGNNNTNAVRSGLQINWLFEKVISPKFKSFYKTSLTAFSLRQTVGIDRSDLHVSRAGIRNNNDLIWVGRAPNIAAKLSGVRNGYPTLITASVYHSILDETKFGGSPRRNMWTSLLSPFGTAYSIDGIYGSSWTWVP